MLRDIEGGSRIPHQRLHRLNALTNPRLTPDGVAEQQPCPIGREDAVADFPQ